MFKASDKQKELFNSDKRYEVYRGGRVSTRFRDLWLIALIMKNQSKEVIKSEMEKDKYRWW